MEHAICFPIEFNCTSSQQKHIEISLTIYSGYLDLQQFEVNSTSIEINRERYGQKQIISLEIPAYSNLVFYVFSVESSFVIFNYYNKKQTEEENIELGISNTVYWGNVVNEVSQKTKSIELQSSLNGLFHLRLFGFIRFDYSFGYVFNRGLYAAGPYWWQGAEVSFYVTVWGVKRWKRYYYWLFY